MTRADRSLDVVLFFWQGWGGGGGGLIINVLSLLIQCFIILIKEREKEKNN